MGEPVLSDGYPGGFPSDRMVEAMYARAAEEVNERVRACHEVVACPKCHAPVGVRCRSMPRGYRPLDLPGKVRELKSPHRQRWTLVQPER